MTNNEFDPLAGGFTPDSPEAYQANEAFEKTKREEENIAAGLNPDGSPKEDPKPAVVTPKVVTPKPSNLELQKKVIPFVKDATPGQLSLSGEQLLIKEKLANEEKFAFYLPLDPGEKKGAVRPVTINGYRCEVPKGMQVMLPRSIYLLLVQAYDAEAEVLNNHENNLANADGDTRRALGI